MPVLKLSEIKPNPDNPRIIKDDKYKKLVKSLQEFPEMTEVREIVVNKDHVILGGNMRYRAMQEAGWKEAPVKIVDWTEEKQREFVIKDNNGFGEWDWDRLANEWDDVKLDDWGIDLPNGFGQKEAARNIRGRGFQLAGHGCDRGESRPRQSPGDHPGPGKLCE